MTTRNPQPFAGSALVVLAAFAAGIAAGAGGSVDLFMAAGVACAGCIAAAVLRARPRAGTASALVAAAAAGVFAVSVQVADSSRFSPPLESINEPSTLAGTIQETPRIAGGTTSFLLAADTLAWRGRVLPAGGVVPCTLLDRELPVAEGDRMTVRGTIRYRPRPLTRPGLPFAGPPSPYDTPYRFVSTGGAGERLAIRGAATVFDRLRLAAGDLIDGLTFGGHGDLFRAMTIGDTRRLDPALRNIYARAGIAHLLAVSGLHAGVLALIAAAALSLLGLGRGWRAAGTIAVLFLYAGVCGFRPPVVRAFVMCSLVLGGVLAGRRVRGEHSLAVAALIILAFDPLALFGASLQLSFAAVWSIVTFHRPLVEAVRRLLPAGWRTGAVMNGFVSPTAVSALAMLATTPVAAYHFGMLPLLSLPVNIVAVPLTGGIIGAGVATLTAAACGPVLAPVATLGSAVTGGLLGLLNLLARATAAVPFSSLDTGAIPPLLALVAAAWMFLLSRASGRPRVARTLVYLPLVAAFMAAWLPVVGAAPGSSVGKVYFLDVGQGDAALVNAAPACWFLVDTGTASAAEAVVVPSLEALGVRRLAGVFVSHLDDDHAGGLDTVIGAVSTDRVFCREDIADSLGEVLAVPVTGLAAGDSISMPGGAVVVLSPPSPDSGAYRGLRGENDRSLVIDCAVGSMRVLCTGDIEREAQCLATAWGERLDLDILKVPHHGAWPLDGAFVEATAPQMAVVSCGLNNRYGHPAVPTLTLLDSLGVTVLRTDRQGTLEAAASPAGITVRTHSW